MTKGQRLLKKFEAAVRADEFKGADEPTTWADTTRKYKAAKKELADYLKDLAGAQRDLIDLKLRVSDD